MVAPGFSSITIDSDLVTIAGDCHVRLPYHDHRRQHADASAYSITTSGSANLTLQATTTRAIAALWAPVLVNVGGNLSLSAAGVAGQANIYVESVSAQGITSGNVAVSTSPAANAIDPSTSVGGITVPTSPERQRRFDSDCAGDLTIADGVTVSEASVILDARTQDRSDRKLVTTVGDMDLTSSTAAIGTSANPPA